MMRKMLIVLALAILTVSSTGCTRCRHLFRRGAPCGGTALAAPAMLGGAIPLGNPVGVPQMVQPNVIGQPNGCYEQCVPCNQCPSDCQPCCESGQFGTETGYLGGDCGCQTAPGEYFGGYTENSSAPAGSVVPRGSGTYDPQPTN